MLSLRAPRSLAPPALRAAATPQQRASAAAVVESQLDVHGVYSFCKAARSHDHGSSLQVDVLATTPPLLHARADPSPHAEQGAALQVRIPEQAVVLGCLSCCHQLAQASPVALLRVGQQVPQQEH